MKPVFVDTSAWYALADRDARGHDAASDWLRHNRDPLVTTNFVVDESLTLLRTRLGHRAAVEFGSRLRTSRLATVTAVTGADEEAAWELFRRHDDQRWSFTDCTSFAVMRRLRLATAFAFDDDFRIAGFELAP